MLVEANAHGQQGSRSASLIPLMGQPHATADLETDLIGVAWLQAAGRRPSG